MNLTDEASSDHQFSYTFRRVFMFSLSRYSEYFKSDRLKSKESCCFGLSMKPIGVCFLHLKLKKLYECTRK